MFILCAGVAFFCFSSCHGVPVLLFFALCIALEAFGLVYCFSLDD